MAYLLALVNAPIACWFAIWGLDHVNHCNADVPPERDCGLGFAVAIPLGWFVTLIIAGLVVGVGFARLPRWLSWSFCLAAIVVMWAVNYGTMSLYQPRTA